MPPVPKLDIPHSYTYHRAANLEASVPSPYLHGRDAERLMELGLSRVADTLCRVEQASAFTFFLVGGRNVPILTSLTDGLMCYLYRAS